MEEQAMDPKQLRRERQRRYHERMTQLGYVRLSVWVPKACKDEFDEEVIRLQERWARANMMP